MVATWLVAAVLAVAVGGVGIWLLVRSPGTAGRRQDVVALSERFAVALASYDYHHLTADIAGVERLSTGNFKADYESQITSQQFQATLVSNQAIAKASIALGPFVASLGPDDASTYTVVNQTLTGKDTPKPVQRRTRMQLGLVRTAAGWRVDSVTLAAS